VESKYKKKKDDIDELEYRALKRGVNEAMHTWEFNKVYLVSDSTAALSKLKNEIKDDKTIPFDIEMYWVKGHQRFLLNEVADFLVSNSKFESIASVEDALLIPSAGPFAKYIREEGISEGIGRAYSNGEERDIAFGKLKKGNIYDLL